VTERRLGKIRKDQPVVVAVEAFDRVFEGRVSRVSPAVDTATRTFTVEVLVENPDRALKPGSFATAEIEVERETAMLLPESAIVTFAGVHKVVLVRGGKAQEQRVELGERTDGMAEIREGVSLDDIVVVDPPPTLTTGTPVSVTSKTDAGEPTAAAGGRAAGPSGGGAAEASAVR
jgi:membrane fusion protein (multidrug efflux system)